MVCYINQTRQPSLNSHSKTPWTERTLDLMNIFSRENTIFLQLLSSTTFRRSIIHYRLASIMNLRNEEITIAFSYLQNWHVRVYIDLWLFGIIELFMKVSKIVSDIFLVHLWIPEALSMCSHPSVMHWSSLPSLFERTWKPSVPWLLTYLHTHVRQNNHHQALILPILDHTKGYVHFCWLTTLRLLFLL